MSGSDAAKKAEWVARVLNVDVGGSSTSGAPPFDLSAFRASWTKAADAWRTASDRVDGEIAELQKALRERDDPDLKRIASAGLNAITGGFKVPLLAAIHDVGNVAPDKVTGSVVAARKAVAAFTKHLQTSDKVAACDRNPFDVSMSIRASLVPALQILAAALSDAP